MLSTSAGIVEAKDGDFGKVDTFLLNGILNGIGRRGGKASNEAIVQKILCHDKIRHIGTDWINKKRREAEVTRRRVLKSYACRFRARIGQSPLHRYQTSLYGSFRNTKLKVPLDSLLHSEVEDELGEPHDLAEHLLLDSQAEVLQLEPRVLTMHDEVNEDSHVGDSDDEEDSNYETETSEVSVELTSDEEQPKQDSLDPWEAKEMRIVYARDTEIKMKKQVEEECTAVERLHQTVC